MTFNVTLFSRKDCHLCEQAVEDLQALQEEIPHNLMIIDIDDDPAVLEAYHLRIPVIQAGSFTLDAPFDQKKLRMTLGAARDSARQKEQHMGEEKYSKKVKKSVTISKGDRLSLWLSKRYMMVINIFLFLYVGLPFLAPTLMHAGLPGLAKPIYFAYGFTCHQLGFRSWFLYGEQPAYPRAAANVEGLVPFGEATGVSEEDLWAARAFRGNETVGYKVAFCERDVAIWGAMLLFGILYLLSKERIPPLKWYWWLLIGIGPIGLDGFSQLLSQLSGFPIFGRLLSYRESTPFLRTLTGGLFGFMTAWFGFPVVKETMEETEVIIATKINRLNKQAQSAGEN